jgi:hypothetical protein
VYSVLLTDEGTSGQHTQSGAPLCSGIDDTTQEPTDLCALGPTLAHVGLYHLFVTAAECTPTLGGGPCVEGPYNIAQGESVPISEIGTWIRVAPAPIPTTVTGSQVFGSTVPTFSASASPPSGLVVSGNAQCTKVNGGIPISNSLAAGLYAIDAASCSGLNSSSPDDHPISYFGGTLTVTSGVPVTVTGSQPWNDFASATIGYTAGTASPDGSVTVSGTVACTTVDGGHPIDSPIPAGAHTIDPSNCSGLTPSDPSYGVSYSGTYTVTPFTWPISISGTWVYGQTPSYTYTSGTLALASLTGSLNSCDVDVNGVATPISGSLLPGTYSIDTTQGCQGLSVVTDPELASSVVLGYSGSVTVNSAQIPVAVSGSWTFGQTPPALTGTATPPIGVTLNDTLTCTTVDGGTPITATLAAGTHTIDPGNCSGLTPSQPGYTVTYSGSVDVAQATPTFTVTGGTFGYNGAPHAASANAVGSDGVTPVTGTYTITYTPGGTTVPVDAGGYAVNASFTSGDANYTSTSGSGSLTINPAAVTIKLASSANPSVVGQGVTFNATVSSTAGTPNGNVQFKVDGANLGSPVALVTGKATSPSINTMSAGTHTISVNYLGVTDYSPNTQTLSQSVSYVIAPNQKVSGKSGSSFPIKIQLLDTHGHNLSAPNITLTLGSPAVTPSPAPGTQPTGAFTFVTTGAMYQYNLKTTNYAKGTYTLSFMVSGDPVIHNVQIVIG